MRLTRVLLLGWFLIPVVGIRADLLIPLSGATWSYWKGRTEASSPDATAWRQPAFDASSWPAGPTPLYFTQATSEPPFWNGGPIVATVLNDMFNDYTCVFLRKSFVVTNAAASGPVTVQVSADDGFILWLNGTEVGRVNMPAGPVPFNGRALASVSEPVPVHSFVLPGGAATLRDGMNVLAVQACNWDPLSGDFGVMAGLSANQLSSSAPIVLMPPQDVAVPAGGTATFQVQAQGAAPLTYHWSFNGTPLADASGATLTLGNVTAPLAGGYSVIVSNTFGTAASAAAMLLVTGPCATPPADLSAWWSLDGTGEETDGAAPLTFGGGPGFGAGQVSQGLALDGSDDYARVAASPAVNPGTATGMSIELWIKPSNAALLSDILEWNNGAGGIGVHLSTSTTGSRDLYANLVDTSGTSHQVYSVTGLLTDRVFQHVALTYDRSSGIAALYRNGVRVALTNLGTFIPQTGYDFYAGTRRSGPFAGIWFPGVIDELSFYRRALSAAEVQAIWGAASGGKCHAPRPLAILTGPQGATVMAGTPVAFSVVAQGTSPLRYQWLFQDSPLGGATQATLDLANVQAAHAGSYAVVVSDVSGSMTSAPVTLAVILPLAITVPPQNVMAVVGSSANFAAIAQGSGPLSYQWLFNGAPLAGANAGSFTRVNVQLAHAGRYTLVVSDATHSVTSAPAVLNVLSGPTPIITEFLAENLGPLVDEDGEASDWIEIFNPGPTAVNLENWYLTDTAAHRTKWRFPSAPLTPNAYLLVFASNKNRTDAGRPLHTNFRLDAAGGYLALTQPDGVTLASEFAPYPSQHAGASYGLAGGLVHFPAPSPGAGNDLGVPGFVADTRFSTNRGFFFAPVDVTIRCATPGATLAYTTNGAEPSLTTGVPVPPLNATSPPSITLRISKTTILRAAAFKDGFVSSDVDTHTYIFPATVAQQAAPAGAAANWVDDPPGNGGNYPADFTVNTAVVNNTLPGYGFTNALLAAPTLSIVTPVEGLFGAANGIYTHAFKEGTNWERRASVELIHADGREGFHLDAGVRTHGAVSRLNAAILKHPLRLIFRDSYGAAKLNHPLFAGSSVQKFDFLVLRACSTDSWAIKDILDFLWRSRDATYQRDQWMRDSQLVMGHESARGIYVQLYLNGLYWGLYNLTERMSDSYFAQHLGGDREDYDVVTDFDGVAVAGTRDRWTELLQLAGQVPSNPNALLQLQGLNPDGTRNTNFPVLLHLDNFIDYMALHIYAAAIDWPGRNWWAARHRGAGSDGFHFFVWDQEIALDRLDRTGTWGNAPTDIEKVYEPNTPAQLYDRLRRDREFQLRFADRLQQHLFNGGALTIESNRLRWAARAAEIDQAIVGESARWGDANLAATYTRQTDWLRLSNFTQNTYWTGNLTRAWTRFKNVGLYPDIGPPAFNQFGGSVPAGFQLVMTRTNAAHAIHYTLDGSDPRLRGGATAPTSLTYSLPVPILSPTIVRARTKNGTNWSALVAATFYPPQDLSQLQLSEVMYNPPRFGLVDGDEVEFLELRNTGPLDLDLGGLTFISGIQFAFPAETLLAPGGYFVLARNAAQFSARHPGVTLGGIYTGKFDNNGETITLATALGAIVWSVTYNNAAPWPAEADNSGLSLQRMNFTAAVTNAAAWIAAPPTPGGALPPGLRDTDGDGMPDGWETDNGFDPAVADSDGDADGDGYTNYQEYLAATDPRSQDDRLELLAAGLFTAAADKAIIVGFSARSNKTYSILHRQPVEGTGWTDLAHFSSAPTNRVITLTNFIGPGAGTRFYRLATPRRP